MRKIVLLSVLTAILYGCGSYDNGELTGVQDRGKYFEPEPFGMVLVQQGSFTMGPNDQDAAWAQSTMSKTVSVDAFYMDQTEITNNEYRQFVYWVRDSIMRLTLAQGNQAENFQITEDELGNELDPPLLNWETKIELDDQETFTEVEPLFLEKKNVSLAVVSSIRVNLFMSITGLIYNKQPKKRIVTIGKQVNMKVML